MKSIHLNLVAADVKFTWNVDLIGSEWFLRLQYYTDAMS